MQIIYKTLNLGTDSILKKATDETQEKQYWNTRKVRKK
jgi:hypothetical protein